MIGKTHNKIASLFSFIAFSISSYPCLSNDMERREIDHGLSISISQSKKHGCFVRRVHVKPDHFDWEGHKVVVTEAWLEHGRGYLAKPDISNEEMEETYLVFRIAIDGKRLEEHRIREKESKALSFNYWGPRGQTSYLEEWCYKRNAILSWHCEFFRLIRLDKPDIKEVKLRVETTDISRPREKQVVYPMTDTFLVFDVDEQSGIKHNDEPHNIDSRK